MRKNSIRDSMCFVTFANPHVEEGLFMKKIVKIIKIALFGGLSLLLLMIAGLFFYTSDSYIPLTSMYEEIEKLDRSGIEVIDDFDQISYLVAQPKKNIVIVPGGKVKPDSYRYLAVRLALEGFDVTIVKTVFDLAILTPNYGARFLRDDLENVVIGHSLGGTVGSLFSAADERVGEIVFLASYPIADVTQKRALIITGEFDSVLDQSSLLESVDFLPDHSVYYEIAGGNHAQFGWYGPQTGDSEATIDTLSQQDIIIQEIINFIE